MESLKRIVNLVFFVDIDDKSRQRPIVDARRAYSRILRDTGCSYEYIGKTIGKNHASIVHYVASIDALLKYDSVFENKFILAKKSFLEENKNLTLNSRKDIYSVAISLEKKLFEIISKKEELKELLDDKDKCVNYCRDVILPLLEH